MYECVYACVHVRYDSRVKAMELDERPTEQYSDIGGLDKQIEEVIFAVSLLHLLCSQLMNTFSFVYDVQLVEAIVLPITHKDRFQNIGIQPPKGTCTCI